MKKITGYRPAYIVDGTIFRLCSEKPEPIFASGKPPVAWKSNTGTNNNQKRKELKMNVYSIKSCDGIRPSARRKSIIIGEKQYELANGEEFGTFSFYWWCIRPRPRGKWRVFDICDLWAELGVRKSNNSRMQWGADIINVLESETDDPLALDLVYNELLRIGVEPIIEAEWGQKLEKPQLVNNFIADDDIPF